MRLPNGRQEPLEIEILIADHPRDDDAFAAEMWVNGEQYAVVTLAANGEPQVVVYGLNSERNLPLAEVVTGLSNAAAELKR